MTLHPAVRLNNLGRISRRCENLRNQGVGIQGDRRDQLLDLLGRELRGRCWCLLVGLAGGTVRAGLRDGGVQVAIHVGRRYFFEELGVNCSNIFATPLSRFLMFLSELLESVSLSVRSFIGCQTAFGFGSTGEVSPSACDG